MPSYARRVLHIAAFIVFGIILVALSGPVGSARPVAASNAAASRYIRYIPLVRTSPETNLYGLYFGPFINFNLGQPVPEQELRRLVGIVAPHTRWIRIQGCDNGLEAMGKIAHEFGLKIAVGSRLNSDSADTARAVQCLIRMANAGQADMVLLGEEVQWGSGISTEELIGLIRQVRQSIPPGIPVTTIGSLTYFLRYPEVGNEVDVVLANIYPYLEGIHIDDALVSLNGTYTTLQLLFPGKQIQIAGTGWRSCDWSNDPGDAVSSTENAAQYFQQFVSWARDRHIPFFYMGAFDETLGYTPNCMGIWTSDGQLKPGFAPVFSGEHYTYDILTCHTPASSFKFTSVPPYGSEEDLVGQACGQNNGAVRVAVYIKVRGQWWIKPTFFEPLTFIQANGVWKADITTGGVDEEATEIRAYLVPPTLDPPPHDPDSLNTYPHIAVTRTPTT